MSVLSHRGLRKSCTHRHSRKPRLAATSNDPHPFKAIWNDIISLASLAAILGTVIYLVLSR